MRLAPRTGTPSQLQGFTRDAVRRPHPISRDGGALHCGDDADLPRPLSKREVADLFGCTTRTIQNWVRAGLLTPLPLPRGPYFSREQIMALLKHKGG